MTEPATDIAVKPDPSPLHPRVKDITGQVFGRLTVVAFAGRFLQGAQLRNFWSCRCSCGQEAVVEGGKLRSGHTRSCGCWHRERSSEANLADITGHVFGRLTVLRRADDNRQGNPNWECVCDCGTTTTVCGTELRSGDTRSCGCLRKELASAAHLVDITRQRFGRLIVLRRVENSRLGQVQWMCLCDCGQEAVTTGASLRAGRTTSCGCRQREAGKARLIDRTGQRYGRLVVVERVGTAAYGRSSTWRCVCDCGNEVVVTAVCLQSGATRSCGCLATEIRTRHGLTGSAEYQVWDAMIQRCTNPKSTAYEWYGARGIEVCDRWRNSFGLFFLDMGSRPSSEHSIERLDNSKGYQPDNCKWATRAEQARNTRRNRFFTLNGETLCLTDWAQRHGMSVDTLSGRLKKGWDIERALTTPVSAAYQRSYHAQALQLSAGSTSPHSGATP